MKLHVKKCISKMLLSGFVVSLLFIISCSGKSDSDNNTVVPNYTNNNLPLTETQDWLIMYYCDADNNLEENLLNDLNEMESVDLSSKKIRIVALVDRTASFWTGDGDWEDSRVFDVKYDSAGYNSKLVSTRIAIESLGISNNASDAEVNMGDGATLTKFMKFCLENYPANKKMLLLSNHGGGWRDNLAAKKNRLEKVGLTKAVCWDDTDGESCLYTSELKTAMSSALGTDKVDILAFDACLMAMVEVAYEMKDVAKYMVASEETIPGYGFPYTQILSSLSTKDLSTYDSETFGKSIVDEYYTAYTTGTNVEDPEGTDGSVTLSLIDLDEDKINTLTTAINNLGSALTAAYGDSPNLDSRICSESFYVSDYVDIKDFCTKESLVSTDAGIDAAATAVNNALDAVVIHNTSGYEHPKANGLSIFMPLLWTDEGEQGDYTSSNIRFVDSTAAPDWRSYLVGITDPTATDQNEIEEIQNGGFIYSTVATTETGYIFFDNDEDYYIVDSDGSLNLAVGGEASVNIIYYIVDSSTDETIDMGGTYSTQNIDISYDPSSSYLIIQVYGTDLADKDNTYTLTFSDI